MEYYPSEESDQGRIFDRRVVRRLLALMRPYVRYLLFACLFLFVGAAMELSYPYITRLVIDGYIVKTGRRVSVAHDPSWPALADGGYFVTQRDLASVDPSLLRRWERDGTLSAERYYYINAAACDSSMRAVIERYPTVFGTAGDLVIADYAALKSLSGSELQRLRGSDMRGVLRLALLFLGFIIIGAVATFMQVFLIELTGQRFMHSLRLKIFGKLQTLDLAFFDRNPVGRLVTRSTNDVEAINEAFTGVFAMLARDSVMLIGIVAIMFTINWRLALIALAVVPPVGVLTWFFRMRVLAIYRLVRRKLAVLNAKLQENLSGIRVIKIFAQEPASRRQFDDVNQDYLQANLREVVLMSFFRPVIEIVSALGMGLVIYYGGGWVISGTVSLGILVAFIAYGEMFFRPIRELTESFTLLQSAMASSERIFQLLDEPMSIVNRPNSRPLEKVEGAIEFRNVWFAYEREEWVLRNVSFRVAPGEHVAIVGHTGAGKTSIINLISRLYEIQKGSILIDGVEIRDITLDSLRSKIGVVMQDVFLFAGDIRSNIRLNRPLEDEQVRLIAAHINADRFIDRFPNKYEESVMERGVTLSTGERQLLSFARALAFDPRIMVLDEATANIDSETERLIQDGLRKLITGRTSIIIAHRLSTIKDVDRIYVLHRGEIKEVGTHEELLAQKGIYHNLYRLQTLH